MKNRSQIHKDNIRRSLIGKPSSIEKRQKISDSLSNGKHHRALLWTVQDPRGFIFITKDIHGLCRKYGIPYSTLRLKHQQKYTAPIWQGRAKGWAVLNTEKVSKSSLQPFEIIDPV